MPSTPLEPYCWPLKPFHRAHPVRAYLNDPRIQGPSRAFHFGIDISAPDGTGVYSVEAGTVYLDDARALAVVARNGREFGYWHVVPAVEHRQRVAQHQLLGHVDAPWRHVHFAERFRRQYRNPLRAGALTPWRDRTAPVVDAIVLSRRGRALRPDRVSGSVDVLVEAHDVPPLPVPAPWHGLPVTPALLRWRLRRAGKVVRAWHAPVDFRRRMLERSLFDRIYAPGTRQNRAGRPGLYRFYLAHAWDTRLVPDGDYHLDVEAADVAGNASRASLALTVGNLL
jgi:hypothetical protein